MSGSKPDEMIRTPMQWTNENGAGFTSGKPWEPVNPDFSTINVAQQTSDNNSLLEYYKTLIQLRNHHAALKVGKTFIARIKIQQTGIVFACQ